MAKKPQISPKLPFEQTTETPGTPDIEAFRAFAPDTSMLQYTAAKRFGDRRREIRDSYGAYTGIPSQVARNAMRDEALRELDESEALALAEGNERAQALKMAQLEALANLTRGQRQTGYKTELVGKSPSGYGPAAISGGASIASAGIIAAAM